MSETIKYTELRDMMDEIEVAAAQGDFYKAWITLKLQVLAKVGVVKTEEGKQ